MMRAKLRLQIRLQNSLLRQSKPLFVVASCTLNRRSENVIVEAIVIPKLKLRNVKWQVFGADLVERAHDTALKDAPETLDCLGMDRANDILAARMVNSGVWEVLVEALVADPLIGAEQANLFGHGFVDEALQGRGTDVRDNASDDVAFAADRASDDCVAEGCRSRLPVALVVMPVLGLPCQWKPEASS